MSESGMMYSVQPPVMPSGNPSGAETGHVRVVQSRPKPQCWEHGCNGRQFSTFSNLLRHQREKSGQAAKASCPNCGAEFTRTTVGLSLKIQKLHLNTNRDGRHAMVTYYTTNVNKDAIHEYLYLCAAAFTFNSSDFTFTTATVLGAMLSCDEAILGAMDDLTRDGRGQ